MEATVVELRVAQHICDRAAVAAEHGDEMLADMLTAEARALQDGRLLELASLAGTAKTTNGDIRCVEELRENADRRTKRQAAAETVEQVVAECWLREGYPAPR